MRILMLDLDTLRPDHLGCYGYHRNTSPNLDAIAARGVRFDNYYCSDAPCLPSRGALVSGRFGFQTGLVGHGGTAADMRLEGEDRGFRSRFSNDSLWSFVRSQGYHTASVSPFATRHSAWWFNAGFAETCDTGGGGMESAEEVTPWVLDWLGRHAADDQWLLHVNYWDPHTPYRAPEEFGDPFADEPLPAWLTEEVVADHNRLAGGHSSREINMWDAGTSDRYPRHPGEVRDLQGVRRMIDGYDCGIRYMDGHIGQLLGRLEEAGVLEDTAIIVTADHGENLGELNCYAEHGTADNITHRIPMIVSWPGGAQGAADAGLRYNLDLAPTLAELLGAPPRGSWQGESYAGSITGQPGPGREELVLGQCCHGCMRSVRFGPWLYMRVIHDFYHLYPREMLFNVVEDPHEQHDLAAARPEVCGEGARRLLGWQEEQLAQAPGGQDPLWTVMSEGGPFHSKGHLPGYLERLEATGRGDQAAALRRRYPGQG